MRHWKTLLIFVGSAVALSACTTTKRVSLVPAGVGGAEQGAIVKADWETLGRKLSIEKIDGKQIREPSWQMPYITEAQISPGVHTIEVSFYEGSSRSTSNAVLKFYAQSAATYQIHAADIPQSFWAEFSKALVGGEGHWTAWAVDTKTGEVVAGRKPPAIK
jgi:hypothetical protein